MKYAPYRKVMIDGDRIQISTEQHRRYPAGLNELVGTLKLIDDDGSWRAYDIASRLTTLPGITVSKLSLLQKQQTSFPARLPG